MTEPAYRLVSKIFESASYPVVVHIFYGKTPEEALSYYLAHQKTDRFLSSCKATGTFMRMRCREEAVLQSHVGGRYVTFKTLAYL